MMKAMNRLYSLLLALILMLATAACGGNSAPESNQSSASPASAAEASIDSSLGERSEDLTEVSTQPLATAPEAEQAGTRIRLNGNSAAIEGPGAAANGSVITISRAGVYTLSGSLSDGQIIIDAAGNATTVQLILDGADITCSNSAPIYSRQAGETILTLAEGSVNILRDGASYIYPNTSTDEPDAAVFAKDNLRINGMGTLEVTGNFNNGIGCKDDLVIEGGNIRVTAANHGIRGRDSLTVIDGTFDITAGNDGIQSNNDEAADKGWISLQGGSFNIISAHDGIQAETNLTISGGNITVLAGRGHAASGASTESYKGLKAGANLEIKGGTMRIDSLDDAVHSNSNVQISGGSLALATGDDGVHADGTVTISGGEIDISTSYEGIEGSIVSISDGTVHLNAADDGINAAGGNDGGDGGQFGRDSFRRNDDWYIDISGGWVSVNTSVDGLDSNGNIFMSGGTVLINGSASGMSAPVDFDNGRFELSGGVLLAAGSSGMAQSPTSGSTQPALMIYFSQRQPANTTLHVLSSNNTPVLSYTSPKDFECIVLSSPQFKSGQSYTIYTGGTAAGESRDGLIVDGGMTGGTKLFQVTLSGATTYVDETGAPTSGGMRWGGRGRG